MSTLAGRLLVAFAAVIIVVVATTSALAGRATSSELRHVMMGGPGGMQMVDAETLRDRLAQSYAATGGWDQAAPLLAESSSHMGMMGGTVVLAGPDGTILAGARPGRLSAAQRAQALPINVRGRVVGLLLVRGGAMMADPDVEVAATRVNRAVWLAASAAGILAFGLAFLIVRTISRPLASVAAAARTVAGGDLSARAPVAGPTEVQSVALAFNQMAESLSHQETLRRAMLADIAHELRTPLAVMQGQIEALEDGVFPPTPEHLAPLHGQAMHLAHVVEDLRTLAHADAGQLALERQPVPLATLVDDLLAGLVAEASGKGVTLASEIPRELPPLDADPVRLRQVLVNVLSNALRHTPMEGTIILSALRRAATARIAITDTGEGIGPEELPHLFERFYRADRSRSRATGGSGLGLAIARRLTEAHGGSVAVSSALDRGTTVTLTWPLWPEAAAAGQT
ncbi:MAG: ATP-binding protein [Ardenticatenaceae bacterium]|nr:ATP-binding protein [Ardenticatenaceae bacterium]